MNFRYEVLLPHRVSAAVLAEYLATRFCDRHNPVYSNQVKVTPPGGGDADDSQAIRPAIARWETTPHVVVELKK